MGPAFHRRNASHLVSICFTNTYLLSPTHLLTYSPTHLLTYPITHHSQICTRTLQSFTSTNGPSSGFKSALFPFFHHTSCSRARVSRCAARAPSQFLHRSRGRALLTRCTLSEQLAGKRQTRTLWMVGCWQFLG
jgi:hypothetical protein